MTHAQQITAPDSRRAWIRLGASFAVSTVGTAGMWMPPVVLPMLQQEFGATRSGASLPYTATMIGVAIGTILMGRLLDRVGIFRLLLLAAVASGAGFVLAGSSGSLAGFALVQGTVIALLCTSACFAPLVADVSHWFVRWRGTAVAVCAAGNYMAGMLWPPIIQRAAEAWGWRAAYVGYGVFSCVALLALVVVFMREPAPLHDEPASGSAEALVHQRPLGLSPRTLQVLIVLAGLSCCVAMSMPQVHIVAYCVDLGYGAARGAEMLSVMLGLGMASRFASGWIADRIGALKTLFIGSALQAFALALYLPSTSLASIYAVSAFFGLVQSGIVPCYAMIVREYFPAREAGERIGYAITSTLVGMALGGWLTGLAFDLTGSYRAAILHGVAWNGLNLLIAGWLLTRRAPRPPSAPAAVAS